MRLPSLLAWFADLVASTILQTLAPPPDVSSLRDGVLFAGLFIQLKSSALSGLCHLSNISDKFVKDPAEHYKEGDKVKGERRH
jgi:transcriptional accessory protein Tex/SPT6